MKQKTNIKNEIMTLIIADMRTRKLIMGLDSLGLSTDDYNSNLSELIFSKMQIQKQYKVSVSNWYEDTIYDLLDTDLNKFNSHQMLFAIKLYDALEEKKHIIQKEQMKQEGRTLFHFLKWSWLRRIGN
jgi:hypothetical protein